MSQQNARGSLWLTQSPQDSISKGCSKTSCFGMPKVSFFKVLTRSWLPPRNRNHLDVNDIKMSHPSTDHLGELNDTSPLKGPDFLRLQKLAYAQLTWLPIPAKNTPKKQPHHQVFLGYRMYTFVSSSWLRSNKNRNQLDTSNWNSVWFQHLALALEDPLKIPWNLLMPPPKKDFSFYYQHDTDNSLG